MVNAFSKLQCSNLVVVFFCFVGISNLIVVKHRVMLHVSQETVLLQCSSSKKPLEPLAWQK